MKNINPLATLLMIIIISLCLIASYQQIDPLCHRSTITLIIFNLLFFPLFFQLNGTAFRKVAILTVGNTIGFWANLLFFKFSLAGLGFFGGGFNAFYSFIYPFLNLMWIVPFWSLSISYLPKPPQFMGEATH